MTTVHRTVAAMLASLATLVACRYNPTPVPLDAEGNSIRGEYLTTGHSGLRQTGKWSVKRTTATEE